MKAHSSNKTKSGWQEVGGWWTHTPLSYFEPLIFFSNEDFNEKNWTDALWQAMGREKFCWVTEITKEGTTKWRTWASDIPGDEYEHKLRRNEITLYIPKIFGQEATYELAKRLQSKVKKILDCIIDKTHLVERQRSGQNGIAWVERFKARSKPNLVDRRTGQKVDIEIPVPDWRDLPWDFTHFEEYQEILELIRIEFDAPDTRLAVIHTSGFLYFDDEGEDASRTLVWLLSGFVEVVFRIERAVLKKCVHPSCKKYFVRETRHKKKYCSVECHDAYHNKYKRHGYETD